MIRGFGQHGAESLVVASQSGNLLWTDDMIAAAYGGMRFGTRRVWSQIVLQWLAQSGVISDVEFFRATAKLVGWRYYFTIISTVSLARLRCEEAASANLKAPSTSKFAPYSETHVLDLGNWQYRVQSYVDAENSFGAHIRTPYTCTVECNAVSSCAITKLHFVQQ